MARQSSIHSTRRWCRSFCNSSCNSSTLEELRMRSKWLAPACIVALLIFGSALYSWLPEQVPSHWNIYGQVDGTTGRTAAVLLLPAIAAGVWLLLLVVPRIDPLRASYAA